MKRYLKSYKAQLHKAQDADSVPGLSESEEEEVAEVRQSEEEEPEPERTRSEAVAAGKQHRASAAASGSISDAAYESSEDCPGQVEPSFHSAERTRLEIVAKELLRAHGKYAVIMIINRLREAFAPNITQTELQDIGREDLVNTLVQIAAENCVEPPDLSEMSARVTRSCEE